MRRKMGFALIGLFFFLSMFISGCSSTGYKQEPNLCVHTETTLKCVRYVRNYDGDTITFDIDGLHSIVGKNISVRVLGIDTPEIRGKKP